LGIEEADSKLKFTGFGFKYHFYDPDKDQNYIGIGKTAVDMGQKYMDAAVTIGAQIAEKLENGPDPPTEREWADCGYNFGVALHFVTDLTQPMHAANFGEFFGERFFLFVLPWDKRHSGFEGPADDLINAGYLDDTPLPAAYAEVSPDGYATATEILVETAVNGKAIFSNEMAAVLPKAGGSWDIQDIKNLVDVSMKGTGARSVARFMAFFARESFKAFP